MTVRDLLTALQALPQDAELLAFEAGCEDYCERELGRLSQATRQRPAPQLGASPARPLVTVRDRCEPLLGARRGHGRRS